MANTDIGCWLPGADAGIQDIEVWLVAPGTSVAERGFATLKDPATNGTSRDWCRVIGLAGCVNLIWPHLLL